MTRFYNFAKKIQSILSFHLQLLLVIIAFISMILVSSFYVSNMLQNHLRRDAADLLHQAGIKIERELAEPKTTLTLVSNTIRDMILSGEDAESVHKYMHSVAETLQNRAEDDGFKFDELYAAFDVYDGLFITVSEWEPPKGYDPKTRPWYKAAVAAGCETTITPIYASLRTSGPVVSYVRHIVDEKGRTLGVIGINVSLSRIKSHIAAMSLTENSYGICEDENFDIIYYPDPEFIGKNVREMPSEYAALVNIGQDRYSLNEVEINYQGKVMVVFSKRLKNDWVLFSIIPKTEYYKELRTMEWILACIGFVFAALLILILACINVLRRRAEDENRQKAVLLATLKKQQEVDERTLLMLDTMPLGTNFWDRNLCLETCNEAAVKLFDMPSKEEYIRRVDEFAPEFQPCGRSTAELTVEWLNKAFEGGVHRFEWLHRKPDGELIPAEITLIRVEHNDGYNVIEYIRDLREHKQIMNKIEQRDRLLRAVNLAATIMLTVDKDEMFEPSLLSGMELMGRCLEADRVQIWQNEMIDEELYFVHKYEWLSEAAAQQPPVPIDLKFPYSDKPEWKEKFLRNEYIGCPLSELPQDDQELLGPYGIKAIIMIPLFLQDKFWGFFSLSDCRQERKFTEEEIDILNSASLMMAITVERHMQTAKIREADKLTRLMLDAIPFPCVIWDHNLRPILCNQATVDLGKLPSKDYISEFEKMMPKYQPCGRLTIELIVEYFKKYRKKVLCVLNGRYTHGMASFIRAK